MHKSVQGGWLVNGWKGVNTKCIKSFLSEDLLQGTSALGFFYQKMAGFGEWGNGTVIFFLGGPLNILEVCDRKKAVLLEEAWA